MLYYFTLFPRRKMQNLLLITQLNVIGAVFNFMVIGKVLDYTSSIWFGKLFLHVSFVVVTGWTMTAMSSLKFSWFSWNCSGLETSWEVTLSSWNWSFFGGWVEIWSTFFCLIVNIKRRGNLVIEATIKIATIVQKFWSSCWSERYDIQK